MTAVAHRILSADADGRSVTVDDVVVIAEAVLIAAAALTMSRTHESRTAAIEAAEIGMVSCLMLFVSPISWAHYFVVLLLPLIALSGVAFGLIEAPLSSRGAACALAATFTIAAIHEISAAAQVCGALLGAAMIVFACCWVWSWRSRATALEPHFTLSSSDRA